jgi:hypothetical protein
MPTLNFFQNQRNSFFGYPQTFELFYARFSSPDQSQRAEKGETN